jgi:CheY-like chemotaxis protein/anti-sigma regulatory factor (Ser/Thr protein kinase)
MMENDVSLAPATREDAALIRRNIELEARLIDDLLDVNRLSQGKLVLRSEAIDPRQLVDDVVSVCAGDASAKNVRLVLHQCAGSQPLHADPVRARQALWNLVKNAVKFTPEGGTVTVETRDDSDGSICFEVRDTGIGIAPEVLPRIFRAFEQGGDRVTRTFGGLGLGLSIAQALAEAHGGRVTAASDGTGKGATFTLRLPCGRAAAVEGADAPVRHPGASVLRDGQDAAEANSRSARVNGSPGLKILLVEDHPDTVRVLQRVLGRAGHDVRSVDSLAGALASASGEAFDLVLCDLHLPDGNGLDLMRQLRAAHGLRGIALSGYGMPEDVHRSEEAGFDRHLIKPVDLDELERAIREIESGARAGAA